jgi:hypothetical protein
MSKLSAKVEIATKLMKLHQVYKLLLVFVSLVVTVANVAGNVKITNNN